MRSVLRGRGAAVTVAVVAAAAGMTIVGVGVASGTSNGVVYQGCLHNGRLDDVTIGTAPTCNQGDTAVEWNATGPPGPQGIPGPAGPAGPQGPAGPAGKDGAGIVAASDDPADMTLPAARVHAGEGDTNSA